VLYDHQTPAAPAAPSPDSDMSDDEDKPTSTLPVPTLSADAGTAGVEDVCVLPGVLSQCATVLRGIMRRREAQAAFNEPVDPVERGIPEYHTRVHQPMDLGTVKQRLHAGYYTHSEGTGVKEEASV